MLDVATDENLGFDKYVSKLCSKAYRKLSVLSRMLIFLSSERKRITLKVFIQSQFQYGPLIWDVLKKETPILK